MKLRKISAGLLACATIVCSLAGCAGGKSSGDSDKSKNDDGINAARDFMEVMFTKNGGEKYYDYYVPADVKNSMKKSGDWDKLVNGYNDYINQSLSVFTIEVESVSKNTEFSKDQCKASEKYFKELAEDCDINATYTVIEGYEFKCESKKIIDEEWFEHTDYICMVNIEGEGWKYVDMELDELN